MLFIGIECDHCGVAGARETSIEHYSDVHYFLDTKKSILQKLSALNWQEVGISNLCPECSQRLKKQGGKK